MKSRLLWSNPIAGRGMDNGPRWFYIRPVGTSTEIDHLWVINKRTQNQEFVVFGLSRPRTSHSIEGGGVRLKAPPRRRCGVKRTI
jgi:hypothetical protein